MVSEYIHDFKKELQSPITALHPLCTIFRKWFLEIYFKNLRGRLLLGIPSNNKSKANSFQIFFYLSFFTVITFFNFSKVHIFPNKACWEFQTTFIFHIQRHDTKLKCALKKLFNKRCKWWHDQLHYFDCDILIQVP